MTRLTKRDYAKIRKIKEENFHRYGLRSPSFFAKLQPEALFCALVARKFPKSKKQNVKNYCARMWDKWVAELYK